MWWSSIGITNLIGNGRHWRHGCCDRQSQCWRGTLEDATEHARERADHLGQRQHVRWSERRKSWIIDTEPTGA